MPITKGRSIEERDRTRAVTPAVLSARAAQTLWPGEEPVGKQFSRGDPSRAFRGRRRRRRRAPDGARNRVAGDGLRALWFNNEGKSVLLVRTAGDAAAIAGELRRVVHIVDPEIAIADITPLQRVVDKAVASRRYQMWLFTAFGAVALLIAAVGVYADHGVRCLAKAAGIEHPRRARRAGVAGVVLVLRQSAMPLAAGLAAGCAGAIAIGAIVATLLFKVRATDPLVILSVVTLVGGVGLLASGAAARQNLRINPAAALRDE